MQDQLGNSNAMPTLEAPESEPLNSWRRATISALMLLAQAFGRELSAPATAVMADALEGLSSAQIRLACGRAMRECDRFPMPATLRKLAGEPTTAERVSQDAEAAWDRLQRHCEALAQREREVEGDGCQLPDCPTCHRCGWVWVETDHGSAVKRCPCVARRAAERRAALEAPGGPAGQEMRIVKRLGGLARFRRIVQDGGDEYGWLRREFIQAWRPEPTTMVETKVMAGGGR